MLENYGPSTSSKLSSLIFRFLYRTRVTLFHFLSSFFWRYHLTWIRSKEWLPTACFQGHVKCFSFTNMLRLKPPNLHWSKQHLQPDERTLQGKLECFLCNDLKGYVKRALAQKRQNAPYWSTRKRRIVWLDIVNSNSLLENRALFLLKYWYFLLQAMA